MQRAAELSGAATSLGELIVLRAIQGVGAGGVMTLAMATVGDIVAPRERGRYQGYIQLVFVLASVAGPLLGGLLVDQLSWRWVFYINVPIGIAALILMRRQPAGTERGQARIDVVGAALFAAAVTVSMLIAEWGGERWAWRSPQLLALAGAAAVLLAGFVWQERRAAEPVLPLRLLRDRVFV